MYYRVREQSDGKVTSEGFSLVANELLTESEIKQYKVSLADVRPRRVSPYNTYISFGARFEATGVDK